MKKILTKEQFSKWENHSKTKMKHGKKRLAKSYRKNQERKNKNNRESKNYKKNRH